MAVSLLLATSMSVQAQTDSTRVQFTDSVAFGEQKISEVTITAVKRLNTDASMLEVAKKSQLIMNNVSAQEIQRTQDNNAGEVIRRVPGISLIDDKFVMVRGLSQRYNNVWMNGGAVPSSEADSRAFSFDIIPSSQIDNLIIVKSPAPEYPSDFSGGFIMINTKEIPSRNRTDFSLGGNWNTATAFRSFTSTEASFSNIGSKSINIQDAGLDNNWKVKSFSPLGDLKLNASLARKWEAGGGKLGLVGALNFTSEYRAYDNMANNLFGLYDIDKDQSNYLRHTVDDQYNHNNRFGAMCNLTWLSRSGNHKYELKNIANRLINDRYTRRNGTDAQSNQLQSAEYYHRSRTTYNGQITGKHTLKHDNLDWSLGYAYADRKIPDRRMYTINDALETGRIGLSNGNDISREFTDLEEHIMSAQVNDRKTVSLTKKVSPEIQFGAYGEYRTRKYITREFIYSWNPSYNTLPAGFRYMNMTELLSGEEWLGDNGLYIIEEQNMRNNYRGNNTIGAVYASISLPLGRFSFHGGARYEYDRMELITNTRDDQVSEKSLFYTTSDILPSVNATYKFDDKKQMRLSYGRSINRPEFREVSPSVYYDFDLASGVQGNTDLKSCHVDNIDFRYEYYPSRGEIISLAAFYKHFDSPIEWTYTVSGGTDLIYSYMNAKGARSLGLELDIRKDLSSIGLRNLSVALNGAVINSKVFFPEDALDDDRPMQGQSPYLINAGLFYRNPKKRLSINMMYNRIGKRLIGVGRSEGSSGSEDNARVPDSYEMPRDMVDITLSKSFGEHWEMKCYLKDIFSQSVEYKQFAKVAMGDGEKEVEQMTRKYKPGRNIGLSIQYRF